MISKIIHYCWFGGNDLPESEKRCIASWSKILPDYQIQRWDESNFDVTQNSYVYEAYQRKKYAFVSDYVRLYALVTQGGIYMDTDVEVIQRLDEFLSLEAFSGFENYESISTGLMGSVQGFRGFDELLHQYDDRHFIQPDGTLDRTTNVKVITDYYFQRGLKRNNTKQMVEGFTVFPSQYFCPALEDRKISMKGVYTIHYKNGSWLTEKERKKRQTLGCMLKSKIKYVLKNLFGNKAYDSLMIFIRKSNK
ncbi:MAG: glycosyltransferase [Acinetobacter sp.]